MATYRCKDSLGRYYVGPSCAMTKRERGRSAHWLYPFEMNLGSGYGMWCHPDVPRMVAKQMNLRVVRHLDAAETRARREARGAAAALDTVLSSMQRIWSSDYYDGNVVTLRDAVLAMAADARRRAGQ